MSITRAVFPFPAKTPSWFAGHMARSLRELPALLDEVDLVLEARDARLPLTSVNPAFDAMLERVWGHSGAGAGAGSGGGWDRRGRGKEKIVVYTKRDLAEARYEAPLKKAFLQQTRQRVLFCDSRVDADVRSILRLAARKASDAGEAATDLKVLVVGMPNVGKSSLLNALRRVGMRRGKAFNTGAMPGVTRKLTGTVRVYDTPPVYVFDTPGVMMPFLGHGDAGAERGLKLALSAGIKDGLFEPHTIADYLLFKLNLRLAAEQGLLVGDPARHESYASRLPLPKDYGPTDNVEQFLTTLAGRLGALRKGGEADIDATITFLLRQFREGKLGRWTLDDLDGREVEYVARVNGLPPPSFVETPVERDAATVQASTLGYALSELGAVGLSDEATEGAASDATQIPPSADPPQLPEPSLDQRVAATVRQFLAQVERERADTDAGRNRSATQQKKAERQAKAEYRIAKQRAKGFGPGGREGSGWSNSGRQGGALSGRPKGRPGRR